MEWLLDYDSFLVGAVWLLKYDAWWVLTAFGVIFFTFIKKLLSYSWQKLLFLYVIKYITFYLVYISGIDNYTPNIESRIFIMSILVFFYLFSCIVIKLLWLNILMFSGDEVLWDIKNLWSGLKNLFSKIRFTSKSNKIVAGSKGYQKTVLKQKSKQQPKAKIKVQVKTQQTQSKDLILPKNTNIVMNSKGEKVYTDKGYSYTLKNKISQGGEGEVYVVTDRLLVKIFLENKATTEKFSKLQKLLSIKKFSGVVFPEKIVYDQNNKFVGFTMPRIFGVKELSILHIPSNRAKYCPHWTYIDLLDLSITIANTLKKIHEAKIIVADFNPRNVLVKSPKKVYFIDIDSYQIQRQPSTVGMKIYIRPIHFNKSHREYLKNQGDDIYALSVIIFQNLMSGGNPYAKTGISNENDLLELHEFSFDVYEPQKSNVSNALINAWSNLSIDLRKFFEDVFRYQKPVLISTLTQALSAHKRTLIRVQTNTRRK